MCLKSGLTEQQILDSPQPSLLVTIDVPLTGSIDDNTQVDEEFAEGVDSYVHMLKPPAASPGIPKARGSSLGARPAPPAKDLIARLADRIATNESHYLCRLADSYVEWRSAIEEKITGSHVYFFVSNHKSKYLQYLPFSGGEEEAVILRVKLADLHAHERDMSDAFAVMTSNIVLAIHLDVCQPGEEFRQPMGVEEQAGANIKIWESIGKWTPLVGGEEKSPH